MVHRARLIPPAQWRRRRPQCSAANGRRGTHGRAAAAAAQVHHDGGAATLGLPGFVLLAVSEVDGGVHREIRIIEAIDSLHAGVAGDE